MELDDEDDDDDDCVVEGGSVVGLGVETVVCSGCVVACASSPAVLWAVAVVVSWKPASELGVSFEFSVLVSGFDVVISRMLLSLVVTPMSPVVTLLVSKSPSGNSLVTICSTVLVGVSVVVSVGWLVVKLVSNRVDAKSTWAELGIVEDSPLSISVVPEDVKTGAVGVVVTSGIVVVRSKTIGVVSTNWLDGVAVISMVPLFKLESMSSVTFLSVLSRKPPNNWGTSSTLVESIVFVILESSTFSDELTSVLGASGVPVSSDESENRVVMSLIIIRDRRLSSDNLGISVSFPNLARIISNMDGLRVEDAVFSASGVEPVGRSVDTWSSGVVAIPSSDIFTWAVVVESLNRASISIMPVVVDSTVVDSVIGMVVSAGGSEDVDIPMVVDSVIDTVVSTGGSEDVDVPMVVDSVIDMVVSAGDSEDVDMPMVIDSIMDTVVSAESSKDVDVLAGRSVIPGVAASVV